VTPCINRKCTLIKNVKKNLRQQATAGPTSVILYCEFFFLYLLPTVHTISESSVVSVNAWSYFLFFYNFFLVFFSFNIFDLVNAWCCSFWHY